MNIRNLALAMLLGMPLLAAETIPAAGSVTVHEWGTFTSVAGTDGAPVAWMALAGPSDLPCFVYRLGGLQPGQFTKQSIFATVRMETPVLYFYAPRPTTVDVRVAFPGGLITEWYPQRSDSGTGGQIAWEGVTMMPGAEPRLPSAQGNSHYFAARNTDSSPIRIGRQEEKLIFYRGAGNAGVPLRAWFKSDGQLQIYSVDGETIPLAIVFESHGGRAGYRLVRGLKGPVTAPMPELTGSVSELRRQLADALVEMGLNPKEAQAMIETWRDSWFEEGARVIYIVPRAVTDSVLPLHLSPAPEALSRVFVGRVELLSPVVRRTLESALATGDVPVLEKYGRFLQPFLAEMERPGQRAVTLAHTSREFFRTRQEEAFRAPACVQ